MELPEIEISIRYKGALRCELMNVRKSRDAAEVLRLMFNADQIEWVEEFMMLSLDHHDKVIGYYKVSKGGCAATVVDTKVVALVAVQSLASKVIIAHNHPSGELRPSEADKHLTLKMKEGLRFLDIELIEHIIITKDSYLSMSDEGFM